MWTWIQIHALKKFFKANNLVHIKERSTNIQRLFSLIPNAIFISIECITIIVKSCIVRYNCHFK